MHIQQVLSDLLSTGDLEKTLAALKAIFDASGDSTLLNDTILLTSRYNQIKVEERQGGIDPNEVRREKNRIAAALTELIAKVPASAVLPDIIAKLPTPTNPPGDARAGAPTPASKIPLYMGIGTIVLAVALIVGFPCPSDMQFFVIRALMALGLAAATYYLSGSLDLTLSQGIKAGGSFAVFALVYLLNPANGFIGLDCATEVPVTVFVHGSGGQQDLVLRQQGHILMDYRGERKRQAISENGEAFFSNLRLGEKIRLNVDFSEPYKADNPDSVYTIDKSGKIYLRVELKNLDKVFGKVLYRDQPLPGVIISIGAALRDTSDELGNYELHIPPAQQRKEQEVSFFKTGFKLATKKAFPQTDAPMNVVMEK